MTTQNQHASKQAQEQDIRNRSRGRNDIAPLGDQQVDSTHIEPGVDAQTIRRAMESPQTLNAPQVLQLQRQIGNRAVAQLLPEKPRQPGTITGPVSQQSDSVPSRSVPATIQRTVALTPARGPIIQTNRNRKARRAQERQATKGRRKQLRRQKLEEAKAYEGYTKSLSEWGNWAWEWGSWAVEKASNIGQQAVTKSIGIDPFEVTKTLVAVAKSNLSVRNKLLYLAMYGSYTASNYIKDNMDSLIGGEIGKMMSMQSEIDEQLERAAQLWQQGGITEEDLENEVNDQIIDMLVGEG